MKKIALSFLLLMAGSVYAQSTGVYAPVGRENNPFVFCKEGVPEHNWAPIDPSSGTWICTKPYCKGLNPQWIATYTSICPEGFKKGFSAPSK